MQERLMRLIELYGSEMELDEGEPSLVAAVRYNGKVHAGTLGQVHWDVAKDIGIDGPKWKERAGIETGFVNHKGHFLSRERALAYAAKHDMLHPKALSYLSSPDVPAELGASFLKR